MPRLQDTIDAQNNVAIYHDLIRSSGRIKADLQTWVNTATSLRGSVDVEDKDEILAMRNTLSADIDAILNP